ncbi:MAG: HAD-IB family phosphatase [Firmicutes bacterium]|nr:HAD-IB family phosphatase [Bacillota bacterium]
MSKETLTRFVDEQFHVDLHFPAFLHYCQQANIAVTVLSDGFDFYIDRIFEKFKIDVPYRANTLRIVDCSLQAQFPYHSADCGDCGNCKLSFAQQVKQKGTKIIYIGDGHSDKCVSAFADVVFAKGILAEHCVKKGIPHYTFETFADVLAVCKDGLFAEITR